MTAKPMKTLELNYPMIQFLIMPYIMPYYRMPDYRMPYISLKSNHITKRLNSCVNRFYSLRQLYFKTPGS